METVRGKAKIISVDLLSPVRIKGRAETEFSFDLTGKPGWIVALVIDVSSFWKQSGPSGICNLCRCKSRCQLGPSLCCGDFPCHGWRTAEQKICGVDDAAQEPGRPTGPRVVACKAWCWPCVGCFRASGRAA